jgi:hypothetical protein
MRNKCEFCGMIVDLTIHSDSNCKMEIKHQVDELRGLREISLWEYSELEKVISKHEDKITDLTKRLNLWRDYYLADFADDQIRIINKLKKIGEV